MKGSAMENLIIGMKENIFGYFFLMIVKIGGNREKLIMSINNIKIEFLLTKNIKNIIFHSLHMYYEFRFLLCHITLD